MTVLRKPVRRETAVTVFSRGRDRPIIVSIEPPGILGLRAKGTRQTYRLPVLAVYILAVRNEVESRRQAKQKERRK